jgi:flagellar basal-body rod protein FlgB
MSIIADDTRLLERLLGAAELRGKVIAANVANLNTPGYLRQEVHFEDLLREAIAKRHVDLDTVQPQVLTDVDSPTRPDGNNVNLEAEMNAMRENKLLYDTYATILQSHFEMLNVAITEAR